MISKYQVRALPVDECNPIVKLYETNDQGYRTYHQFDYRDNACFKIETSYLVSTCKDIIQLANLNSEYDLTSNKNKKLHEREIVTQPKVQVFYNRDTSTSWDTGDVSDKVEDGEMYGMYQGGILNAEEYYIEEGAIELKDVSNYRIAFDCLYAVEGSKQVNTDYEVFPSEDKPCNSDSGSIKSTGDSSTYYKVELPDWILDKQRSSGFIMIEDLIEILFDNDFNYANIMKAQKRMFETEKGKGKDGTSFEYDANKCKYYTLKQVEKYNRD